jgi:alkaline phosphatase D
LQPSETVAYEVASDNLFNTVVSNGTFITNDSLDYTVKIDVAGLLANTTYYYRFKNNNKTSAIGRTRTAPSGTNNEVKFAVISCSSIYSGYFNAYRNIASRNDAINIRSLDPNIPESTKSADRDNQIRNNTDTRTIIGIINSLNMLDLNFMGLK